MTWPMVKLGELCELQNGYAFKSTDYVSSSSTLSCRMSNIRPGGEFDIDYNARYLPDNFADKYSQFLLKDGNVIIAMTDLADSPKILGVPTVVKTEGRNILLNQRVGKLEIKDKKNVYFPYLKLALNHPSVRSVYKKFAGGGLQINLGKADLLSVEIPLPPLEEQKRLAAILDKADSIRRKRQQAIQLADDFLRAVFLDMFGDPVTNPKGWDIRPLEDCLEFLTSGSRGWAQYYSDQGSKFIRIQNVSKNRLLLEDMAYVNAPDGAESTRTRVQIGDVLLSITADLGRSAVVNDEIAGGHINQHLALLRVNQSKINSRFLSAYLSSDGGVKQFQMKNKSAVKAGLNFNDIRTLMIPIPPLNIQKKYENVYDHISIMNEHCLSSSNEIKNQIAVLSQKAFSGEL